MVGAKGDEAKKKKLFYCLCPFMFHFSKLEKEKRKKNIEIVHKNLLKKNIYIYIYYGKLFLDLNQNNKGKHYKPK